MSLILWALWTGGMIYLTVHHSKGFIEELRKEKKDWGAIISSIIAVPICAIMGLLFLLGLPSAF